MLACKRRKLVSWRRNSGERGGKDTWFALRLMEDSVGKTEVRVEGFSALMTLLQF